MIFFWPQPQVCSGLEPWVTFNKSKSTHGLGFGSPGMVPTKAGVSQAITIKCNSNPVVVYFPKSNIPKEYQSL